MHFTKRLSIRLTERQYNEIQEIIEKDKGKTWENECHFVRCAIIKQIRGVKYGND
jgi:Arc/MetJ-type ribon-helix-helix transcriptional regulator